MSAFWFHFEDYCNFPRLLAMLEHFFAQYFSSILSSFSPKKCLFLQIVPSTVPLKYLLFKNVCLCNAKFRKGKNYHYHIYRNVVSLPHKYKNTLVFDSSVMRSTLRMIHMGMLSHLSKHLTLHRTFTYWDVTAPNFVLTPDCVVSY